MRFQQQQDPSLMDGHPLGGCPYSAGLDWSLWLLNGPPVSELCCGCAVRSLTRNMQLLFAQFCCSYSFVVQLPRSSLSSMEVITSAMMAQSDALSAAPQDGHRKKDDVIYYHVREKDASCMNEPFVPCNLIYYEFMYVYFNIV